jgi:hypothetical protein
VVYILFLVSIDDNILAAVGCVIAVHHDTYLHQLLLLVTPFVAKEDTIMTTHTGVFKVAALLVTRGTTYYS